MLLARDQALLFQRLQMTHHAIGRFDPESQPDLADRRTIASTLDLLPNEVIDFRLAFGKLAEVRHNNPFHRYSLTGQRP